MDKQLEQELFEYVYGEYNGWSVCPSESPDFICEKNNNPILGSEVTELYYTESEARLRNIKTYTLDLLNGGRFRHKDDRKFLKIEKVKYVRRGENDGSEINAIINKIPDFDKRVELLTNTINAKEGKVESYLRSCPMVDLVINDASRFFLFEKYEDLFSPLSRFINRNSIIRSRFREIYLITSKQEGFLEQSIVRIPLKLNLFAEDITILEDLIRNHKNVNEHKAKNRIFIILLYCLYKIGYEDISVISDEEGIGLTIGSCLFLYTKNGKNIREYMTVPEQLPKGDSISEVNDEINDKEVNIAIEILKNRKNYKCCMSLFMKAKKRLTLG